MIDALGIRVSRRFLRVWQRNLTVYRKGWKVIFLPPFLEPFFYLIAFGVGLSGLIGTVSYRGAAISYIQFIAPALIAVSIMNNTFFETTYASFVRMYYQRTFDAMMATPLSIEEVITGEIIWGATKSLVAAAIMLAVISLFGVIRFPGGFLVLPLAFLGGIAFGSIGMFFTATVKNIEMFNLPVFLFVTPMFVFSGTFFPLENLPSWSRLVAQIFPLTHVVDLARSLCLGRFPSSAILSLIYLILFSAVFFPLALQRMRRRLIR